jgi:YHS domain-containing protein
MKFSTLSKSAAFAVSILASSLSFAADIDANADINDVAISGYDTVAYFTQNKAVSGSSDYTATYKNAIYKFTSAKHRDLFKANPEKYAPQFGGYCAFGVSIEKKFDVDPHAFKVVDNKLYLNLDKSIQKKWLKDVPGYINSADSHWGDIKDKTAKEL